MLTNWSHHKGSSTLTAHKRRTKVYSREEHVQSEEYMPLLGVSQSISISPHSQKVCMSI